MCKIKLDLGKDLEDRIKLHLLKDLHDAIKLGLLKDPYGWTNLFKKK